MDLDVEITELEKIDATRVDGVGTPANGIPILLMKAVAEPVEKDWADWDAAHEGAGNSSRSGNSAASAADAVARAKATIAAHRSGKKVSAADLKNAHEVHEAHLAHLAHEEKLRAEGKEPKEPAKPKAEAKPKAAAKPPAKPAATKPAAAKPAAKKELAKGGRNCPSCDAEFDADHKGNTCSECGAKLPSASDTAKALARAILADLDGGADLLKAVDADGQVDEGPDIDKANQILALLGQAIQAEAQEMAAGQAGEAEDIMELACAANAVRQWRDGEQAVSLGDVMPASLLMQSAAADVAKEKHNTADRKKLAEQGNALSDGSYPIADEEDLKSAAILAQSGHGDVTGAKKLIARRAKELKVDNPLESGDDTSKSQIAEKGATVDTVTQDDGSRIAKAVEDAVTKATAPLKERIQALDAELAKVKATPIPGGPYMSAPPRAAAAGGEDLVAKARYYREMADSVSDPDTADGYRQLARQADPKAAANA